MSMMAQALDHPPIAPAVAALPGPGGGAGTSPPGAASRRFARDTLWNVAGLVAPLPLGLLVVPYLGRRLGVDRFGVLSLAWAVIGYFSVFDLGLGRALVKLIAERGDGWGRSDGMAGLFWTTMALLLALGLAAGVVIAVAAGGLARTWLRLPEGLRAETAVSLRLLALSMPAMIVASGPMGLLTALGRFSALNRNRLVFTTILFAGPAAVAAVTPSLPAVVGVLVLSRYCSLLAYLRSCRRAAPWVFPRAASSGRRSDRCSTSAG